MKYRILRVSLGNTISKPKLSTVKTYTQIPMLILVLAITNGKMPSLTFRLPVLNFVYIDNSRFSIARFPPLLISVFGNSKLNIAKTYSWVPSA